MLSPCQQLLPAQPVSVSFPPASRHPGTVAAAKLVAALHLLCSWAGLRSKMLHFFMFFLPSHSSNHKIKQEAYGKPCTGPVLRHDAGVLWAGVSLGHCARLGLGGDSDTSGANSGWVETEGPMVALCSAGQELPAWIPWVGRRRMGLVTA